MSDTTTMPFQPGTVATAPDAPDYDESTGNKRTLLVLALLGGLAVVLIAAYFLLFAGGSDDKPAAAGGAAPSTATQPSAAPSTATKTAKLPKISKKNFGTDPFKALLADAPVGSAATGTTAGTSAGTTAGTSAGTNAGTSAGTTTDTTSGTSAGTTAGTTTTGTTAPAASQAYHFRVMSVSDGNTTIDVKVDGKSYNGLKAGEVFAKIFKVRYIGGSANAFQIGDEVFNVVGTKAVNISS